MQLDIAWFVHTMHITKTGSDGEVRADLGERGPDVVDIFWLSIEGVVVDILVVDTVLLASSNSDFLDIDQIGSNWK